MSRKFSLFAITILLLIAVMAPSASAAPSDDACLLITQAQLSEVLGVSMAAGQHTTPTYVKTCTWVPSSGATPTLKFVTLNLESSDKFEAAKKMMSQMAQMQPKNATFTQASGVGDDAYYASFGPTIMNLSVSFKLALYGATPAENVHGKNPGPANRLKTLDFEITFMVDRLLPHRC
jgi:hypothetical protein